MTLTLFKVKVVWEIKNFLHFFKNFTIDLDEILECLLPQPVSFLRLKRNLLLTGNTEGRELWLPDLIKYMIIIVVVNWFVFDLV